MPRTYLLKNIKGFISEPDNQLTGHKIHLVEYSTEDGQNIPIFYKENKKGNPEASVKEVAFSELARLFMLPHSTPEYHLVGDSEQNKIRPLSKLAAEREVREDTERRTGVYTTVHEDSSTVSTKQFSSAIEFRKRSITGVASHHIQQSIARQVDLQTTQFKRFNFLTETKEYQLANQAINNTTDIPYQFLNNLPHGFFAYLMAEKNKGALSIDMDSLASTFSGKYTLEEDDLHKGNFGIYTIIKDNKPHIVFFNIDHDLMLSDSIMSFLDMRISNWAYGEKAFNITAKDLLNFPDLHDSENHYWPTHKRFMVKYDDDKAYTMAEERAAFRNLKDDPEFNRYKWKRFLKSILIPNELMQSALALHYNPDDAKDAAEINLITQALNERIIKLRTVLLSIPEFRSYLTSDYGKQDMENVKQELSDYMAEALGERDELIEEIRNTINKQSDQYLQLCDSNSTNLIHNGDNSLHICIKLGQYRFDESQKAFGNYLNTANPYNKNVPMDSAAEMALTYEIGSEKTDPGKDPFSVIKHLLSQGAKMTPKVIEVLTLKGVKIEDYHFQSKYYEKEVRNYADLRAIVTEIGRDNHLSLKTKKQITVNVIKQHINTLSSEEIEQLKLDLNGTKNTPVAPEFLFISQLRSSLWIVRAIRGLYGNSSTKMELNEMINVAQTNCLPMTNQHQFFSTLSAKGSPPNYPKPKEEEEEEAAEEENSIFAVKNL